MEDQPVKVAGAVSKTDGVRKGMGCKFSVFRLEKFVGVG